MGMRIGTNGHTYKWIEGWARLPESESAQRGWAHPGVAVTADGEVITVHPGEATLLVLSPEGGLRRALSADVTEAHGLTAVLEDGVAYLWVADSGSKRAPGAGYAYPSPDPAGRGGQAVKLRLDGDRATAVLRLGPPDLPAYREGKFSPTAVAVYETRHGGNGDVWVADGYGQHLVHRFDRAGRYLGSLTGEEGPGGPFRTPHAVHVDTRTGEPELYVADRGNRRLVVYDLEGGFKRIAGQGLLTSPSAFAAEGEHLVVAELRARLTLLDRADRLVGHLGENEAVCAAPGWPNAAGAAGHLARPAGLAPGRFHSPHGIAADGQGNLYVAEWLIGGRYTKLARG
jgi:hypothetical protein